MAPQSAVRATAQYDAAAALIGLKDWDGAARALEDFRQRFPNHPLQAEVGSKLARGLPGTGPVGAGRRRVRACGRQPARTRKLAREALWQAAELHEKAARRRARAAAAKAYERYLQQYPQPLEPRARSALAPGAHRQGRRQRRRANWR